MKQLLVTTVNGQRIERYVDPSMRLVDFLRDELLLTGTKIGCKQGAVSYTHLDVYKRQQLICEETSFTC